MRSRVIGSCLFIALICYMGFNITTTFAQSSEEARYQIKDIVWLDVNSNSFREPGEPGIDQVVVRLLTTDSLLLQQTSTNEAGTYVFEGLLTGTYLIEVDTGQLSQYRLGSARMVHVELREGLLMKRAAFSFQPLLNGRIAYRVWHDENGNHLQDPDEAGIPAVAVRLYNDARKPIGVAVTDNSGFYSFGKLPKGNYYVAIEDAPQGYALTTPSGLLKTVATDEEALEVYFGLTSIRAGAICNRVVYEVDGQERGIEGVTINLFDTAENLMGVTVTDSSGYYIFNQLAKDTYHIQVDLSSVPQSLQLVSKENIRHTLQLGEVFDKGDFVFQQLADAPVLEQCVDVNGQLLVLPHLNEGEYINMEATRSEEEEVQLELMLSNMLKYAADGAAKGRDTLKIQICKSEGTNCREELVIVHRSCSEPIVVNDGLSIMPGKLLVNGKVDNKKTGYDGVRVDVLENDQRYCQDQLYLHILENADYGYAVIKDERHIFYRPNAGFEGKDRVYYQVCNECGDCDEGFLAIEVKQPVMHCDPFVYQKCANPNNSIVVCPDFCLQEAYTITDWETVFGGTVEIMDQCIKYTAGSGVSKGDDVIKVTACTDEDCETSFVNITIGCEGAQPPVTIDDKAVSEGETVAIDVLQNDTDPDGSALKIASHTSPQNGDVSLTKEGLFLYTPFPEFIGTDVFYYQVCDADSLCLNAKVSIEVSALDCDAMMEVQAMPVIPVQICPDFCKLKGAPKIENVTSIQRGNVTIKERCLSYSSAPLFVGTEYLHVTACDETENCETVRVAIEVSQLEAKMNESSNIELLMLNTETKEKEARLELESVVPNQSFEAIYINFTVDTEEDILLEVYDLTGKLVHEEAINAIKGFNAQALDISDLITGIYQVQLKMRDKVVRSKFVK